MLYLIALMTLASLVLQTINFFKSMAKLRIDSDTLTALVTLAEAAVAADAHDKDELAALKASIADEKDVPGTLKDRINALVAPATPANPPDRPLDAVPPAPENQDAGDGKTDPPVNIVEPGKPQNNI